MKEIINAIDRIESPITLQYVKEHVVRRLEFVCKMQASKETNDQIHCTGAIHEDNPALNK